MAMRFGTHPLLEAEANRLIRESLKGVTSFSAKKDVLTPWKEGECRRREVYSHTGVPDSSVRQGLYRRSPNTARPDLNSRDGVMRSPGRGMSTLEAFVAEHRVDG
jgi:hypothetical protein